MFLFLHVCIYVPHIKKKKKKSCMCKEVSMKPPGAKSRAGGYV